MALTVAYVAPGRGRKEDSGFKTRAFNLTFGNGTLTYGTGVAIDKKMLGCPNLLSSLVVIGQVVGYVFNFDRTNSIMHIYQVPAATGSIATVPAPLVELASSATPAAITITVEAVGW